MLSWGQIGGFKAQRLNPPSPPERREVRAPRGYAPLPYTLCSALGACADVRVSYAAAVACGAHACAKRCMHPVSSSHIYSHTDAFSEGSHHALARHRVRSFACLSRVLCRVAVAMLLAHTWGVCADIASAVCRWAWGGAHGGARLACAVLTVMDIEDWSGIV